MGIVPENNVCHLGYLACFVKRSVYIEHRYGMRDALYVDPFSPDKVFVDEAASYSTVE